MYVCICDIRKGDIVCVCVSVCIGPIAHTYTHMNIYVCDIYVCDIYVCVCVCVCMYVYIHVCILHNTRDI